MVVWSSFPLHIPSPLACNLCKHYLSLLLCSHSTDAPSEVRSFMPCSICPVVWYLWDEMKLLNKSQQRACFSVLTCCGNLFSRTNWASPALEWWDRRRRFPLWVMSGNKVRPQKLGIPWPAGNFQSSGCCHLLWKPVLAGAAASLPSQPRDWNPNVHFCLCALWRTALLGEVLKSFPRPAGRKSWL